MPFTQQQFFDVFARYNQAVWPAQPFLYAAAIIALVLALRGDARNSRYACGLLALLWLWTAAVYHAAFFRHVNPAAMLFAALFLAQAALLFWYGVIRGAIALSAAPSRWRAMGAAFIVYGLLLYPLVAIAGGQRYPSMPTFGVPCPTTIFMLGILMWSRSVPAIVWLIPVLWAFIAAQVAVRFGVYEDFGLILAALAAVFVALADRARGRFHRADAA